MMPDKMGDDPVTLDLTEILKAESMDFEDAVHHAAVCYVKAGIPVIPLEPNSKKLPGEGGINYMSASKKLKTIENWFGPEGKFRGFNIGIGCGTKGGVMALDIDTKPNQGTNGLKELTKILSKEGDLPPGPKQQTPSGGFHYLYRWQSNAINSSSKVAPGLDTRGGTEDRCSGHIVAYPSEINGVKYMWEVGGEVPPMPAWLSASMGEPWRNTKEKDKEEKQEVPIGQINRMLTIIDPDNLSYEDWVKVGMALKSSCGEDGLELWDEWSSGGARRKANECKARWKTFLDDGPVGFGTLLFMAKEAGWRPLPGDVQNRDVDAEIEERVLEMNKHYALVRMGKNVIIATFSNNAEGEKVGFLSVPSFITMSAPDRINIGRQVKAMSDVWLSSPHRRAYFDIGIYPNDDAPSGTLNMWNGWGETADGSKSCVHYLMHIKEIICDGDEKLENWLLDWMADAVQDSRNIKGTCIVLRGVEGCGKGAWADQFGLLFGKHYKHLIDAERLTAKFNSLTSDSVVVFADEVLWPGDRKAANILKGLVTERRITRESKGIDAIEVDNLNHVIIASNEEWIVPAGPGSRRWLVLNVSAKVAKNSAYFKRLFDEMDNGGRSALLHFLKNRKVTSDLRTAPVTKGLLDQRRMSHKHDSMLHFLSEVIAKGGFDAIDVNAKMDETDGWPTRLNLFEVFNEYRVYCRENRVNVYDSLNMIMFSAKILEYGFVVEGKTVLVPTTNDLRNCINTKQGIN